MLQLEYDAQAKGVTFGTIPIVDLVLWALMLTGFLYVRFRRSARIFLMVVYLS
ncbi:hypothetical protein [Paenibacillus terrae]|uniref:hypothetical protein n=1 Tax=Paenibacillus terrae TaxID=159743 RepID=UPI001BB03412|nr:hypothetical protein [Paenibacillus terrae]